MVRCPTRYWSDYNNTQDLCLHQGVLQHRDPVRLCKSRHAPWVLIKRVGQVRVSRDYNPVLTLPIISITRSDRKSPFLSPARVVPYRWDVGERTTVEYEVMCSSTQEPYCLKGTSCASRAKTNRERVIYHRHDIVTNAVGRLSSALHCNAFWYHLKQADNQKQFREGHLL